MSSKYQFGDYEEDDVDISSDDNPVERFEAGQGMSSKYQFGDYEEDDVDISSNDDPIEHLEAGQGMSSKYQFGDYEEDDVDISSDDDPVERFKAGQAQQGVELHSNKPTDDRKQHNPCDGEKPVTPQWICQTRDDILVLLDSIASDVTELTDACEKLGLYVTFVGAFTQEISQEIPHAGLLWIGLTPPLRFEDVVDNFRPCQDRRNFAKAVKGLKRSLLYSLLAVTKHSAADLALTYNLCTDFLADVGDQNLNKITAIMETIGCAVRYPSANGTEVAMLDYTIREKEEATLARFRPMVKTLQQLVHHWLQRVSGTVSRALETSSGGWIAIMERVGEAHGDELRLSQVEAICKKIFDPNNVQMLEQSAYIREMSRIYNAALAVMVKPIVAERQSLESMLSRLKCLGYQPSHDKDSTAQQSHDDGTSRLFLIDDIIKHENIVERAMADIIPDRKRRVFYRKPLSKRAKTLPIEYNAATVDQTEEDRLLTHRVSALPAIPGLPSRTVENVTGDLKDIWNSSYRASDKNFDNNTFLEDVFWLIQTNSPGVMQLSEEYYRLSLKTFIWETAKDQGRHLHYIGPKPSDTVI